MSRLMSVAFTEQAVVARTKTVTRRKGWLFVKPGDRLTLCRKVQGRRYRSLDGTWHTAPLERLAEVEVVSVRREPLSAITQEDVALEGYPNMTRAHFVNHFFVNLQGIFPHDDVTRIEWCYLDEAS